MQSRIFLVLSALALFATSVLTAPVPVKMVARQEGGRFTSTYIYLAPPYIAYANSIPLVLLDESIPVKSDGNGVVVPYEKEKL